MIILNRTERLLWRTVMRGVWEGVWIGIRSGILRFDCLHVC